MNPNESKQHRDRLAEAMTSGDLAAYADMLLAGPIPQTPEPIPEPATLSREGR